MDLRVIKTKDKIQRALITLAKNQPLSNISISKLCRTAGIDRNTFYAHYGNIMDVLNEMEENYETMTLEKINEFASADDYEAILLTCCKLIQDNPALLQLVCMNELGVGFLARITESCTRQLVRIFERENHITNKKQMEYVLHYAAGGSVTTLLEWCRSGLQTSPEKMAKQLADVNRTLITHYLNA